MFLLVLPEYCFSYTIGEERNIRKKTFLGFSVAEAMVTLLIASIAVAVAAPMFTKRSHTTANNSLWLLTSNGADITRTTGKVGIHVPSNANPDAFLDIRSNAVNATNLFTIRRGDNVIFSIDNLGRTSINLPSEGRALSIRQDGTENGYIEANGTAKFTRANLYRPNGRVFEIGTDAAHVNAWIDADGNSSFGIPPHAVMFFNSECPTDWGWHPVNANWIGRYPKMVANAEEIGLEAQSVLKHKHISPYMNDSSALNIYFWQLHRRFGFFTHKSTWYGGSYSSFYPMNQQLFTNEGVPYNGLFDQVVDPNVNVRVIDEAMSPTAQRVIVGDENRPKTIKLVACEKR